MIWREAPRWRGNLPFSAKGRTVEDVFVCNLPVGPEKGLIVRLFFVRSTMSAKTESAAPEFTGWRKTLWPIHNYELKKFLPMALMMLFILFNYTLMRDTKDVLVSTAPGCAAEAFSFLKLGGVLPCAVLFMLIYVKMANVMSSEKIFYTLISAFMIFFGVFGIVLYPLSSSLHASPETLAAWREACPDAFYWPLALIANWTYSLFYIMSELWGSIAISMLFWQFANATTKVNESKRFYAFYGLVGNVGLFCSSGMLRFASYVGKEAAKAGKGDGYAANIFVVSISIVAACLAIMFIYRWIQKNVLTDPKLFDPTQIKAKKSKPKLSLGESFKCIFSSSYLGLLLVIVLGYNIGINLIEMTWKSQIRVAFPDKNDYSRFMGNFSGVTAAVTIFFSFVGMNILQRCKWRTAALMTPVMLLGTGSIFFGLLIYARAHSPFEQVQLLGMTTTVVMLTVVVGLIQNVLSKGPKYTLFDSTKQMAYIPLDPELKTKGQAAVEVVGGRFGKSGGAFIQSVLLMISGAGATLLDLSPIIAPIVLVIVVLWVMAICGLNPKFLALTAQREAEAKEASKAKAE